MHLTLGDLLRCQSWEPSLLMQTERGTSPGYTAQQRFIDLHTLWIQECDSSHQMKEVSVWMVACALRALLSACSACMVMAGFTPCHELYFRKVLFSVAKILHMANYFICKCVQYPTYAVVNLTIDLWTKQFCQIPEVRPSKYWHMDLTCASQT